MRLPESESATNPSQKIGSESRERMGNAKSGGAERRHVRKTRRSLRVSAPNINFEESKSGNAVLS